MRELFAGFSDAGVNTPVILRTPEECAAWMTERWPEVAHLQRFLPDGSLTVLAREVKRGEEGAAGGQLALEV